jgi:hypothetical protein
MEREGFFAVFTEPTNSKVLCRPIRRVIGLLKTVDWSTNSCGLCVTAYTIRRLHPNRNYLLRGSAVLEGPWPPHVWDFLKRRCHLVGLLGRVISPSQGLYLHGTAQHRKARTNIHDLSGSWPMILVSERSHSPARAATATGFFYRCPPYLTAVFSIRNLIGRFMPWWQRTHSNIGFP